MSEWAPGRIAFDDPHGFYRLINGGTRGRRDQVGGEPVRASPSESVAVNYFIVVVFSDDVVVREPGQLVVMPTRPIRHPVSVLRQRLSRREERRLLPVIQQCGEDAVLDGVAGFGEGGVFGAGVGEQECRVRLPAGALPVLAPRPAAGPALAFFELLLGPANAPLSSHLLLGILDPADELIAGQRGDVPPGSERLGVRYQRRAQVCRQLVHHPTRHPVASHGVRVTRRASKMADLTRPA
jgi:hypothetical protein